jgi:HlyD family secretion protein
MSKSLKWILISVALLLIVLIALSKMGVFGKDEGIKVTTEKVQKKTIIEVVNATGKIYPEVEVKVSPDISGEITELNVQEGDTVKRGQVVARIYADIYNIQRNQAASGVAQSQAQVQNSAAAIDALKAQVEQAERTYNMQKTLFDDKVISLSEFNIADANFKTAKANYNAAMQGIKGGQAGVQTARASLDRANKDLNRTVIVAPMDGVISLLNVKKGEKVAGNSFNVGTEMMRIADMNKIEIRVDVPENDIVKVHLGDTALVEVEAYSNRKFKGIVTKIASSNNGAATSGLSVSANSDVTQYKVNILMLAQSYMDLIGKGSFPFKPGMSATADIQTKTHDYVLSVPINAVTTREKTDSTKTAKKKTEGSNENQPSVAVDDLEVVVFVVQADNTVKMIKVKTDIQDINNIEITAGLKRGDEVVTGPYDVVSKTLKEGAKIKKVDKKELFEK